MEWREFLKEESNDHQPIYFYLAQIALEVRRSFARNPQRFKLRDFLISFTQKKSAPQQLSTTSLEDRKKQIAKSKAGWLGWLGIKK